jgi:hypothetical protein
MNDPILMTLCLTPLFFIGILLLKQLRVELFPWLLCIYPISRTGPLDMETWPIKSGLACIFFVWSFFQSTTPRADPKAYHYFQGIFLAMIVMLGVSWWQSVYFDMGWSPFFQMSASILFFFVFYKIMSRSFFKAVFRILFLLTAFACGLVILQYLTLQLRWENSLLLGLIPFEIKRTFIDLQIPFSEGFLRLPSFFYHYNEFGHWITILFNYVLAFMVFQKNPMKKRACLLLLILMFCASLLTLSRGTLLVIFFQILLLVVLHRSHLQKFQAQFWWILLVAFGIALILFWPYVLRLFERVLLSGVSHRDVHWSQSLSLLWEHWIFGAGPGTTAYLLLSRFPPHPESMILLIYHLENFGVLNLAGYHSHQFYLHVFLELGVIQLCIQLLYAISMIILSWKLYRKASHLYIRVMASAIGVTVLGSLFRGLFESHCFFLSIETGFLFSLSTAFLLFLYRNQKAPSF